MPDYSNKSPRRNSPFSTPFRNAPPTEGAMPDTSVNIATAFSNSEHAFKKPMSPYRSLSSTNVYISPRPKRTTYLNRSLDDSDFFAIPKPLDLLEKNDSILNNIVNNNYNQQQEILDDEYDSDPFAEEENLVIHPEEEERRRSFIQRHAQRTGSFQSMNSDHSFLYNHPTELNKQQSENTLYDSNPFKEKSFLSSSSSPKLNKSSFINSSPYLSTTSSPLSPSINQRYQNEKLNEKKNENHISSGLSSAWGFIKSALDSMFEFCMFWIFMVFWVVKEIAVVFFTFIFMVISTFFVNPFVYLLRALGFQHVQPLTWTYIESIPSHRLYGTMFTWFLVLLFLFNHFSLIDKNTLSPFDSLSLKKWINHQYWFSSSKSFPSTSTSSSSSWDRSMNEQSLLNRFSTLEHSVHQLIQRVDQQDGDSIHQHLKQLQQQLSQLYSDQSKKMDNKQINEKMKKVEDYMNSMTIDYKKKLKELEETLEKNKNDHYQQHHSFSTNEKISPELLTALQKIFISKDDYDINLSQFLKENQSVVEKYIQTMMDNWINDQMNDGKLVTKDDLMKSVMNQLMGSWKPFGNHHDQKDDTFIPSFSNEALSVIHGLIDTSLQHYHQDVLNLPDYALALRGGRILPGYTSSTFIKGAKGWISKWWLKQTRVQPSPLLAITPDAYYAGHCWPMEGNQGSLGIQLSEPISITSITLEYPSSNVLNHKMSSAPKEIELWGLKKINGYSLISKDKKKMDLYDQLKSMKHQLSSSFNNIHDIQLKQQYDLLYQQKDDHKNIVYLGSFIYDIKQSPSSIQTFQLDPHDSIFEGAIVRVLSNWGNDDHTCLYRIRIHGNVIH